MSPMLFETWDGEAWRPYGGAPVITDPDRTLLVAGEYVPDSTTTGPLPSYTSFIQVEANVDGYISFSEAGRTYDGFEFWGQPRAKAPGIKVTNSIIHGAPPGGLLKPLVRNYDVGYYHVIYENCLFDPFPWYTQRGRTFMTETMYINRFGWHGGDVELRWCHIRNVEDGINFAQGLDLASDPGNTGWGNPGDDFYVPAGQRFTIVDRSLIELGTYVNGAAYAAAGGQSGGYCHGDGIQFNTGRNFWATGTMVGGARNPAAYQTWNQPPLLAPVTRDFVNSAYMIQQDGGVYATTDARYVTNVLIEDGFAGGGQATFNMYYKNGNPLAGVTVRRMKLLQRSAGWGQIMENGVLTNSGGGVGRYLAWHSSLTSSWSDVTVLETGTTIPRATT